MPELNIESSERPDGAGRVARVARWPSVVALLGALLGLWLSAASTRDYVAHLDRQVHDIHCSIIPGAAPVAAGGPAEVVESGCRTALYSPYSALLKDRIWGGVPISLVAVGAFSFFVAFCLYLVVGGGRVARRGPRFLAAAGLTPLAASLAMAAISAVKLGTFCQTCIGIYLASIVLAVAGLIGWRLDVRQTRVGPETTGPDTAGVRPLGGAWLAPMWLFGLGVFALAPAALYFTRVPSYRAEVSGCGELVTAEDPKQALLHVRPQGATHAATLVVDPLCPTCKAFHERLVADGVFDQLDTTLVLFPLDSACNWNLQTPLHPGACTVAQAVICGEERAFSVLEWAYANQEALLAAARSREGEAALKQLVFGRFAELEACVEGKASRLSLDEHLRYAVANKLPLSTPQLFLNARRLCEEDIDIGLPYALAGFAPELKR